MFWQRQTFSLILNESHNKNFTFLDCPHQKMTAWFVQKLFFLKTPRCHNKRHKDRKHDCAVKSHNEARRLCLTLTPETSVQIQSPTNSQCWFLLTINFFLPCRQFYMPKLIKTSTIIVAEQEIVLWIVFVQPHGSFWKAESEDWSNFYGGKVLT